MRKMLCSLLLLLTCSLPALAATPAPTTQVALTWGFASGAAWSSCSSTVKAACNDYLLVYDNTVTPAVLLNTAGSLAPTATAYTAAVPSNNAYTSRSYTVVVMYKDIAGAEQTGPTSTCGSGNTAPPCAVTGLIPTAPPNVTGLTGTPVVAAAGSAAVLKK